MKVKTSITVSQDLLNAIEQLGGRSKNRSSFFEAAMWAYLHQLEGETQAEQDIEIINKNAGRLNKEAADVLTYQVSL